MIQKIIFVLLVVVLVFLIFGAGAFFLGCKSFEPIWMDQLPPECNMTMNMAKIYYDSKDKSGVVASVNNCFKCLIRLRCQAEVFGYGKDGKLNPVDYNDAMKYRAYEQCRSEMK